MMSREKIAHDYLIFRYPTEYLLIFFPTMVGLLVTTFSSPLVSTSQPSINSFYTLQTGIISNYLLASKITILILISFFICYRWSNMLNEGSYGFWLTTGVNRKVFYIKTAFKFTSILFITQFLGIITLILMNAIVIEFGLMISLFLSVYAHILFITTLAIFLSDRLRNPEFASIGYLTLMGFNLSFNRNSEDILFVILQNDLAFQHQNAFFGTACALIMAFLCFTIGLRIHVKHDIDI